MRRTPKRFHRLRDPLYVSWVRGQHCVVQGCHRPGEPMHVRSRGAGGEDRGNVVPCCRRHHDEAHVIGHLSFAKRYQLDLQKLAGRYLRLYRQSGREHDLIWGSW